MKGIKLKLILLAFGLLIFHCDAFNSDTIESTRTENKITIQPELGSILVPVFPANFQPKLESVSVSAKLDISQEGIVTRIAELKVTPDTVPEDQILKSIFLAKFSPALEEEEPVQTNDFDFKWQFEVQRMPTFKVDVEIENK